MAFKQIRREIDSSMPGSRPLCLALDDTILRKVGKNRFLRYAIAETVMDDDTSLFQKGVNPDLAAPFKRFVRGHC